MTDNTKLRKEEEEEEEEEEIRWNVHVFSYTFRSELLLLPLDIVVAVVAVLVVAVATVVVGVGSPPGWPLMPLFMDCAGLLIRKLVVRSMGRGKMMVEWCSAAIPERVWRYRSCKATGLSLSIKLASRRARDAFRSPSA